MFGRFVQLIKPLVTAGVIIVLLYWTGLLSGFAQFTQSAVLKTGAFDASVPSRANVEPDFDFNFMIKDMQGNRKSFSEFKGKVIFLNLWATWCGPCRAEMPTIQGLYESLATNKVEFVMLSQDRDADKDKIVRYVSKSAFTFPVYQPSGYLSEQLDVPNIPTTFIISRQGKIVAKYVGMTNFNTNKIKKFITNLTDK